MRRITVIILAYNRPALLADALASVLGQTRRPDEVLVIDDASPQPLADALVDVAGPGSRVVVHRNDANRGPAFGAVRGLLQSTGELVAFLDDDDLWEPEFLEHLEQGLEAACASFAFCDHHVIDARGRLLPYESDANSLRYGRAHLRGGRVDDIAGLHVRQSLSAGSFMLAERAALRPELIGAGSAIWDYFAALSVCLLGRAAFYSPERLGSYRLSPSGITASGTLPANHIRAAGRRVAADRIAIGAPEFSAHRQALARSIARTTASMGKVVVGARSPRLLRHAGVEITNALVRPYVSSWQPMQSS